MSKTFLVYDTGFYVDIANALAKNGDGYYAVKGMNYIATLVGYGETYEEAIDMAKDAAEYVDCQGMDKDSVDSIDKIKERIEHGKDIGITF